MQTRRTVLALTASLALGGCNGGDDSETIAPGDGTATERLSVRSSAFEAGGEIPTEYTVDGANVSPPLEVDGVPSEATTLAVVLDDPDAGTTPFVHWLLWNVPAETASIPRELPTDGRLDQLDGALQGTNDFGDIGYGGPSPPKNDGPHRYRIRVWALDTTLSLSAGAEGGALDDAMSGHVLAAGVLRASYGR